MTNQNYVAMANESIMNNAISTIRKNVEYNAKEHAGKCFMCDYIHAIGRTTRGTGKGTKRIETPSHVRGLHVCEYHERVRNCLFGYSFEFNGTNGKATAKHISNSIEFETKQCTLQGLAIMVADYGFCPTEDCTVDVEFKSPIYLSLQGMTKALGGIEYCVNNDLFKVTSACGTHLHTSVYSRINENGRPVPEFDYTLLGRADVYEKLFFGVCRYFATFTHSELLHYFGSDFRSYAQNPAEYRNDNYTYSHSAIFNVQHSYSLEFRLPRFSTADVYRRIVLFMQEIVTNVAEYQRGRMTAEKCGNGNLAIAKKYFPVNR